LIQPLSRWIEPDNKEIPPDLLSLVNGNILIASALFKRGIDSVSAARAFLDPNKNNSPDPYDLPGMKTGVNRLCNAIRSGEKIGIWGDFDVDGQTATTVLVETFRSLNADVSYHIPVRGPESHGISVPVLSKFLSSGINVLVSCDTGISEFEAANYCLLNNVDLIITDHHSIPDKLPEAYSLINPRFLPDVHPLFPLAGVGTAFLLAKSVALELMPTFPEQDLLDLVALGTLADVAELRGENRFLTRMGIFQLRNSYRMAIRILLENANTLQTSLSEEDVNFILAPRMNSVGRLGDANPMVEFLTTNDIQFANTYALLIEGINGQRRILLEEVYSAAMKQIENDASLLDSPVLIVSHPDWPGGVLGLVASRLVQLFHKPAVVLKAVDGGTAQGSARSIEGINIIKAITQCSEILTSFGGHPLAAGLSLLTENLPKLMRNLSDSVISISPLEPLEEFLEIDSYQTLSEINPDLVEQIATFSPFGPANPPIVFAVRDVKIVGLRLIGRNMEHTKLTIQDCSGVTREVIHWQSKIEDHPQGIFDLAFSVKLGNYRGEKQISFEWINYRTVNPESINISKPEVNEIQDLRNHKPEISLIKEMANQAGKLVFCEGPLSRQIPFAVNRMAIHQIETLILISIPPDWECLSGVLEIAHPQKVIVYDHASGEETIKGFLTYLGGLIKFALRDQGGNINLTKFAMLCNQSTSVIRLGLDLLSARGEISTERIDGNSMLISLPGRENPGQLLFITEAFQQAFQETLSFRAFYQKADLNLLFSGINSKE